MMDTISTLKSLTTSLTLFHGNAALCEYCESAALSHTDIWPDGSRRAFRYEGNTGQQWQTAVQGRAVSFLATSRTPRAALAAIGNAEILKTRRFDKSHCSVESSQHNSSKNKTLPDLILNFCFPCLRELLK